MQSFMHGIVLALGLILPLGVQNLLVFNQGVMQANFFRALPVVVTAAACDTLLILLAVHSVSLLLLKFSVLKIFLLGLGTVFLGYMGWLTWNKAMIPDKAAAAKSLSVKQQIVFAVTVSLLNPHAVLDTIGVIGTSSANYEGQDKLFFTLACIMVSWGWFFLLAAFGRVLGRQKEFAKGLVVINKVSALFMWGSALYMISR